MPTYDAVVVGARCAGAAIATFLARAGMRVCLLDKASFPSETPSTHIIQPRGVALLAELGVLEAVLAHDAARLDRFSMIVDDVRIDGFIDSGYAHQALNVRRTILDHALQEQATAAGAELRTRVRVDGVRTSGDRVVGVDTADGPVDARLVIGADGRNSVIANSVGAQEYLTSPAGRVPIWGYFATGPQEPRLRIARRGNLAFLASPTDSGLYMATVAVDHRDAASFQHNREPNFQNAIRSWPELADIIDGAERVGPLRVMSHWHSYFRESAGPGWVLVGDAGHFKDFTPGQGISDALSQAKSLSTAITRSAESPPTARDDAMTRWWRHRDRSSFDMYWFAQQMAPPGPASPLATELLKRVASDPRGAATVLQVINRDVPTSRLLTPSRLLMAAISAFRHYPDQRRNTAREIGGQLRDEISKLRARLRGSVRRTVRRHRDA